MVTMRRRVTNEQDRFGGYGVQPSVRNESRTRESFSARRADEITYGARRTDEPSFTAIDTEERIDFGNMNDSMQYTQNVTEPAEPIIKFSTRYSMPSQTADSQSRKARRKKRDDFMPDILAPSYSRREDEAEVNIRQTPKVRSAGKTKLALVVYLAVVVALAITVIATGVAVCRVNSTADSLTSEIEAKNAVLAEQSAEIHSLTDLTDPAVRASVAEKAGAQGMTEITSSAEVELLPTTEPTVYEGRTNWFDKLGDWLSKIIGG